MEITGIEPVSRACKAHILPLNYIPISRRLFIFVALGLEITEIKPMFRASYEQIGNIFTILYTSVFYLLTSKLTKIRIFH